MLSLPSAFVARRHRKHEKNSCSHHYFQAGWSPLGTVTSGASCWIHEWDSERRAPSVLATGDLGCVNYGPGWKGSTEDSAAVVTKAILSQYENVKQGWKSR